ncbi:hypothetical protein, partial [Pseudomonas syringae]
GILGLNWVKNVGGGLAPDEGGSVDKSLADPLPSGASPLPHLIAVHQVDITWLLICFALALAFDVDLRRPVDHAALAQL